MTTTTNDITAAEWLDVRDRVADHVKKGASPQTQRPTLINIAESLLRDGFIDIAAVLEEIKPKPRAASFDPAKPMAPTQLPARDGKPVI